MHKYFGFLGSFAARFGFRAVRKKKPAKPARRTGCRLVAESLEVRQMLSSVTFTDAAADNNLNNSANYAASVAPSNGDSVTFANPTTNETTTGLPVSNSTDLALNNIDFASTLNSSAVGEI